MTVPARRLAASFLVVGAAVLASVLAVTPAAAADTDEERLAERFAPVLHLVDQPEDCGPGEPYRPSDVALLMDNDSVALRGPWGPDDLVSIAPSAEELSRGLDGYALDYPGDPLKPGCTYEEWSDRTFGDTPVTVYAHVVTQEDEPDRLALQYWFHYPFNDFNNKHEGDWESIQLEFDVGDVAAALQTEPERAVYSAHEGSEHSSWDDSKLTLVDGTHPEVYVAAGSHASHFTSDLFLLRSATQGFGCDTTLNTSAHTPVVHTIPADPERAVEKFPWIGFDGLWGEDHERSIYRGAGGPNVHRQWTEPFAWSEEAGDRSYPVPGGAVYGVKTTDFFCQAVGDGSVLLLRVTADPGPTLAALAAVILLAVWLVRRTSWQQSRPLPLAASRTLGQTIGSAWAAFRTDPLGFLGIGAMVALVSLGTGAVGQFVADPPGVAQGEPELQGAAAVATIVAALAMGLAVLAQQAASVAALGELGAPRRVSIVGAYRMAFARWWLLLRTALLWSVIIVAFALTLWLAIVALLLIVAWSLYVVVVMVEDTAGLPALRRSWRLVRGQFGKVTLVLLFNGLLTAFVGGLAGFGVLVLAQAPFVLVNLVPGVVAALLGPFTSLAIAYCYYDGVARESDAAARSGAAPSRAASPNQ